MIIKRGVVKKATATEKRMKRRRNYRNAVHHHAIPTESLGSVRPGVTTDAKRVTARE